MKTIHYQPAIVINMILLSFLFGSCNSNKSTQVNEVKPSEMTNDTVTEKISSISYREYKNQSFYIIGLGISAKAYFLYPQDKDFEQIMDVLKYSHEKKEAISIFIQSDSNNRSKIINAIK